MWSGGRGLAAALLLLAACKGDGMSDRDDDGTPDSQDCASDDPTVFPGAAETCDGIDQDCDGEIDDDAADAIPLSADHDGDGAGDRDGGVVLACEATESLVANADDCDDSDPSVGPNGEETCDGVDQDCDGVVDDVGPTTPWFADGDGDGFGDPEAELDAPCAVLGFVADGTDCDDHRPEVHPGAEERCDDLDNDCDGAADEDLPQVAWYTDHDGDGFGDPGAEPIVSCERPEGTADSATDCDDTDIATFPGAYETCDGTDEDCDQDIDEDAIDAIPWFPDTDSDGFGDADGLVLACSAPTGAIATGRDCDDGDPTINPRAIEVCDGIDGDCDGIVDDSASDAIDFFRDRDEDGFGDVRFAETACDAPTGFVADDTDCDDHRAAAFPGADEYCNGWDDDCDGIVDDATIADQTWYLDADGDGFGDPANARTTCVQPGGYVERGDDCDDADGALNPAAHERCNRLDDDCDGLVDDDDPDAMLLSWFHDDDGDGFGDGSEDAVAACTAPLATDVQNDGDCDDGDATVHRGASEDCANQLDDDCDGSADAADPDCVGILAWTEEGAATVDPGTSWSGVGSWSFELTDGTSLCAVDFESTSTTPLSTCAGCDFAFEVTLSDSHAVDGDCATLLGWVDGQIDGMTYGYGFDSNYVYGSYTFPAFMYYSTDDARWYAVTTDASLTGDQFEYDWTIGYYYY